MLIHSANLRIVSTQREFCAAQELEHTSATLAAMDASNDRLAEGREELRSHRGLFSGSRRLLRALFTSSVLDTVSLYGGLAVFFLVVAYILQVCASAAFCSSSLFHLALRLCMASS